MTNKTFKSVVSFLPVLSLLLASCSDFTDIKPKGKNLLSTTDDINLLFNQEYYVRAADMMNVGGSSVYAYSSVPALINVDNPSKTAYQIKFADSEADMVRYEILSKADGYYTGYYSYIGTVANPALAQLKTATGGVAAKNALKAEALTLRAYAHYMLLQKFAKAYNPATATSDPAIAYMTEDAELGTQQPKKTVQEAYELCLKDIDEAIELNAMPKAAASVYRLNRAAMYAVKALVCLSMQRYADAEEAAKDALAENGSLYDYYVNATTEVSEGGVPYKQSIVDAEENPETYFDMPQQVYYTWVQPEVAAKFEDGYATYSLFPTMNKQYKDVAKVDPSLAIWDNYGEQLGLAGWDTGNDFQHYISISGLCSPMMYLVLAECELKNGSVDNAMGYLDLLRAKRLDPAGFKPLKGRVTSRAEAIDCFKNDYLAEFIWTAWTFVGRKRWNVDPEWRETLTRTIEGTTYTLLPTSGLWVFPFPSNVREANPYMTSNRND